jgi:toxin YoeB
MKLIFAEQAWDDYLHWQATDKTLLKRINRLIEETRRSPFSGTGKPEPLKHALSGY